MSRPSFQDRDRIEFATMSQHRAWNMLAEGKEIAVEVHGLVGTASPFKQGGSLRITLPKKIARVFVGRSSIDALEDVTFFFIKTNVGILMCTLSELSGNPALKDLVLTRGTSGFRG